MTSHTSATSLARRPWRIWILLLAGSLTAPAGCARRACCRPCAVSQTGPRPSVIAPQPPRAAPRPPTQRAPAQWDEARFEAAVRGLDPVPGDVEPMGGEPGQDPAAAAAPWTRIRLKKSFINLVANRVTVFESAAVVRFASASHHCWSSSNNDSDTHVAIDAPFVNLPVVAELKNCDHRIDALERLRDLRQSHAAVRIEGVWRVWCEHPQGEEFDQTEAPPPYTSSNPAHVFEIHPILLLGDMDVTDTLVPACTPVPGQPGPSSWKPKEAASAFATYDGTDCDLASDATTVTIKTPERGLNHVEFLLELTSAPTTLTDGLEILGDARTLDGQTVVHAALRCTTPSGAPPAAALAGLTTGARVHVMGMPRISLKRVLELVDASASGTFSGALPYEITIVGVYP